MEAGKGRRCRPARSRKLTGKAAPGMKLRRPFQDKRRKTGTGAAAAGLLERRPWERAGFSSAGRVRSWQVGEGREVFSGKRRKLTLLGVGQGGESRGRFVQAWL